MTEIALVTLSHSLTLNQKFSSVEMSHDRCRARLSRVSRPPRVTPRRRPDAVAGRVAPAAWTRTHPVLVRVASPRDGRGRAARARAVDRVRMGICRARCPPGMDARAGARGRAGRVARQERGRRGRRGRPHSRKLRLRVVARASRLAASPALGAPGPARGGARVGGWRARARPRSRHRRAVGLDARRVRLRRRGRAGGRARPRAGGGAARLRAGLPHRQGGGERQATHAPVRGGDGVRWWRRRGSQKAPSRTSRRAAWSTASPRRPRSCRGTTSGCGRACSRPRGWTCAWSSRRRGNTRWGWRTKKAPKTRAARWRPPCSPPRASSCGARRTTAGRRRCSSPRTGTSPPARAASATPTKRRRQRELLTTKRKATTQRDAPRTRCAL
jgi:hypothetical protein